MSPTDVPDVLALAISSILLLLLLPGAVRSWKTYSGVSGRRQEDATGHAPMPEWDVRERIAALQALGYRRIGETWTSTPSGGGATWVLASADEEVYALLAPSMGRRPGLTGFYSAFPDGEWLGTLHPRGDPYETAGLRIRIEKGTLQLAEAGHRGAVDELRMQHGTLRRIRSLADVLVLDADYRTRFGGRELRPLLYRALFPVALLAFMVVFFAVALFNLP